MPLPERKARLKRLFDRLSGPYAHFVFSRLQRETRADISWIEPRAQDQVLDLACGPGTLALELAPRGCAVYAVDLAEKMILLAQRAARRQGHRRIRFGVADAEQLPFGNNTFDLVTCAFSFSNFPSPGRAAAEMYRVTRFAGRVAVLEVVAPEDFAQSAELDRLERLRSAGVPAHLLSLSELRSLFEKAGLSLLDAHVSERRRRIEDWLGPAATKNGGAARRRLRNALLRTANGDIAGLHLERHRGHWLFCARVARLLWRKNEELKR